MKPSKLLPTKSYAIVEDRKTGSRYISELVQFMNERYGLDRGMKLVDDYPERFISPVDTPRNQFGFIIEGKYKDERSGVVIATLEEALIFGKHSKRVQWVNLDKIVAYPSNHNIMTDMIALVRARLRFMRIPYAGLRTMSDGAHQAYSSVTDVNNDKFIQEGEYHTHGIGFSQPFNEQEEAIFTMINSQLQKREPTLVPK